MFRTFTRCTFRKSEAKKNVGGMLCPVKWGTTAGDVAVGLFLRSAIRDAIDVPG